MNFGNQIKARRKQIGMTQKELAKGICAQSTISKIEKDMLKPSSTLLNSIADRLKVSISYFFSENDEDLKNDKVDSLINEVQMHLNRLETQKVRKLLQDNHSTIEALYDLNQIYYFKMVEAYLDYYSDNDSETAIEALHSILNSQQLNQQLKIDVLGMVGIIFYEEKNYKEADSYFKSAINLFSNITPVQTRSKILLNHALNLEDLGEDKLSMNYIIEGIDLLVEHQSMYNLGYFYSHKAYLYNKFSDLDEAIKAYENAVTIFNILDYSKMSAFTYMNLLELKAKRKEQTNEKTD